MPRRPKCSASFRSGGPRRPAASPGAIERVQHDVEVLGRRRHVLDDVLVEGDEADAIALLVDQVGQARGQRLRVIELAEPRAERHRLRHVEQDAKFAFESASNSLT